MNTEAKKITIPVCGMHCKSCEILIEDNLANIKGVKKAEADFNRGRVDVFYDQKTPDQSEILEAITSAGYQIGQAKTKTSFFSREVNSYRDLGLALLVLIALYIVLKELGLTSLNFNLNSSSLTLPLVLLVGLTAGVSTCMALVGGLVLGVSAKYSEAHPQATVLQKFSPHLFFNLGRILGYAALGGILGLAGSIFQMSSLFLGLITLFVALVMLFMGTQLIGIFPWADNFKLTLPKSISRLLGVNNSAQQYNKFSTAILGALTFFLPCGFTQAMQIYAVSTGSFTRGALIMGAFALGTAPGILSIGGLVSFVKGRAAQRFFKLAGLLIIMFGVFNITNAFTLLGINYSSTDQTAAEVSDKNVSVENGVQVVRMTETQNGYVPNHFTISKDLPVKWIVNAQDPYSCASVILLKKYSIRKFLLVGENTIDFTPTELGEAKFSCSMGMYNGSFTVVN